MYSELCHPPKKVCQENREYRSSRDSGAPTNKLHANYRNRTKFRLIVGSVLHLKRVYEGGGGSNYLQEKNEYFYAYLSYNFHWNPPHLS